MRYLPHTQAEIQAMLSVIGVDNTDSLFESIPQASRAKDLVLPPALSEPSLMRHLSELAHQNTGAGMSAFMGGGMYDHHIPPAVDQLLLRSEYYTAYTPYQAEVAQGTLQATFEFQTMVSELFSLPIANASMYDGASAAAEATLMARRIKKPKTSADGRVVMSGGLHPDYKAAIRTYLSGLIADLDEIVEVPVNDEGCTDWSQLSLDAAACFVVGYPNVFGCVENLSLARKAADACGALLITATAEPYALGVLQAPGTAGADIAVGEGQAIACPPQYGGPGVGLFACKDSYLRQIPGRLVGQTVDQAGERGYVLTLSTREQHIRRQRATSNICTNHGLIALSFAMRLAMLGKTGFVAAARQCVNNQQYLKRAIESLSGFSLPFASPTFNEWVVRCPVAAAELRDRAATDDILIGVPLSELDEASPASDLLVAVTEKHTAQDMDALVTALEKHAS